VERLWSFSLVIRTARKLAPLSCSSWPRPCSGSERPARGCRCSYPERDTPQLLKGYVGAFDPSFIGLTGTAAQIDRVAEDYRVVHYKERYGSDCLIDHSTATYINAANSRSSSTQRILLEEPAFMSATGNDSDDPRR
jgi:SCO1/SenC